MESFDVDEHFTTVFQIDILKGRGFSKDFTGDLGNSILINETAAKQFGWNNPIGRQIFENRRGNKNTYTVVGMFKDFHNRSLHHTIDPMVLLRSDHIHCMTLRLAPGDFSKTLKDIRKIWNRMEPSLFKS